MSSSPEIKLPELPEVPAGVPLFDEDGALSREFLLHRGFCCGNGCRNCPYIPHDRIVAEVMPLVPKR